MELQLTILNRSDLKIKGMSRCYEWEVNVDYLTNEKSTFIALEKIDFDQGDFLLAKSKEDDMRRIEGGGMGEVTNLEPFFFGVIESIEDGKINACHIYNLMNFDFAATRTTGTSAEQHLEALFTRNITLDPSKTFFAGIRALTNTDFSYMPSDPPTATNLVSYLINFFQKYNIVFEVDSIARADWYGGQYQLELKVEQKTKKINLKNNAYDFVNWSVYEQPAGRQAENMLRIIDKRTTNSVYPTILSTWYLTQGGELTQSFNENVYTPTRQKIVIYDTTEENKPTYLEVAQSELSGQSYAHEINFDLKRDNNMIDIDDLEIGLLVDIVFDNTIYSSVLTGYVFNSTSSFISLRFGNVRSTLQAALNNL